MVGAPSAVSADRARPRPAGASTACPGLPNETVGTSPVAVRTIPPSVGTAVAGAASPCQGASADSSPWVARTVSPATAERVEASVSVNCVSADCGRRTSTDTRSGCTGSPARTDAGSTAETRTSTFSVPEGKGQE